MGGGTVAVLMVAVLIARWEDAGKLMGWSVVAASVLVLGVELSVRGLLAVYARRSIKLAGSLDAFGSALDRFNATYDDSLALVKRAELASRGYRLGAGLLPPIGRLEATDSGDNGEGGGEYISAGVSAAQHQLRCVPLRRRLRAVNDELQAATAAFSQNGENKRAGAARGTQVKTNDAADAQAPSLLLTALAKQHNRTVLQAESAMHSVLVQKVAGACTRADGCSLFTTLASHRVAVKQLVRSLDTWTADLDAWNTTNDPVKLVSLESSASDQEYKKQYGASSAEGDIRLKGISTKLQELRSMSETLTALVIAAQHEMVSGDSAVKRLVGSREAMRSMAQHLQEAWDDYDAGLSALGGEEDKPQDTSGEDVEEDEEPETKPTAAAASSLSVPTAEDLNCTVVFTGTSTGDEGFDLQALLKQQEADTTAAASPTPYFVCELRDVLAHRQAHAQPGLTKQVDHDPPVLSSPVNKVPAPPPADTLFSLPRAPLRGRPRRQPPSSLDSPNEDVHGGPAPNAFNVELQALLQRAQPIRQQDVLESLGDSDHNGDGEE
ncbi:hypothetical protein ON010_g14954 [Phytophthora cinnamomi]|nr:hypothetical protein ON010_g14954 [Phytophthora cinnamomi]